MLSRDTVYYYFTHVKAKAIKERVPLTPRLSVGL